MFEDVNTKQELAQKLVQHAIARGRLIANTDKRRLEVALREGKPIPEICKPGRVIMGLSEDKRKLLKDLKSSDFKDDFPFGRPYSNKRDFYRGLGL